MKRANRLDANHHRLTAEFQSLGCSVYNTSRMGDGFPDVVIGYGGRLHGCEYKVPKKGKVLHSQSMWAASTRGCWHLVKELSDVHELIERWAKMSEESCAIEEK